MNIKKIDIKKIDIKKIELILLGISIIALFTHNSGRILCILWGILGIINFKNENKKYIRTKFEWPMIIYFIGLFCSLPNALYFKSSFKEIYRCFFPFIMPFAMGQVVMNGNLKKKIIDNSFSGIIIFYFFYILLQQFGYISSKYGEFKFIPFNLDGVAFGYIIGIIYIYNLCNILKNKITKKTGLNFIFLAYIIIINNTRGVWLGLFITSGIIYILSIKNIKKQIIEKIGLGIIISGLLYFFRKNFIIAPYVKRIESIMNTKTDGSNLGRLQAWNIAWEKIRERPILGWGYKPRLSYDTIAVGKLDHPHNEYLNYLVGTGVVGLIGYLYMMFYILYISFKRKDKIYWLNMFGIIIFTLIYGGVELLMQVSNSLYIMLFMLGIAINSTIENEGKINEKSICDNVCGKIK